MNTITLSIEALRELWSGLLLDLVTKLCSENGSEWAQELKRFLRKEPTWVKRLLKSARTVDLPAIKEFCINDIVDSGDIDGVRVVFGDNFKKVFGGKVDRDIPAETLRVSELVKESLDEPIIAELGGKENATVKLAQVFEFMRRQGRSKKDAWFVFYVEDDEGKPWVVYCFWCAYDCRWRVDAYSTSFPFRWYAVRFIVSRDSDSKSP